MPFTRRTTRYAALDGGSKAVPVACLEISLALPRKALLKNRRTNKSAASVVSARFHQTSLDGRDGGIRPDTAAPQTIAAKFDQDQKRPSIGSGRALPSLPDRVPISSLFEWRTVSFRYDRSTERRPREVTPLTTGIVIGIMGTFRTVSLSSVGGSRHDAFR